MHGAIKHQAKHFFYAAGWKKFEAAWNTVIRARQLSRMTPVLEAVLSRVTAEARPTAGDPRAPWTTTAPREPLAFESSQTGATTLIPKALAPSASRRS